jgi:hypothetical protein
MVHGATPVHDPMLEEGLLFEKQHARATCATNGEAMCLLIVSSF